MWQIAGTERARNGWERCHTRRWKADMLTISSCMSEFVAALAVRAHALTPMLVYGVHLLRSRDPEQRGSPTMLSMSTKCSPTCVCGHGQPRHVFSRIRVAPRTVIVASHSRLVACTGALLACGISCLLSGNGHIFSSRGGCFPLRRSPLTIERQGWALSHPGALWEYLCELPSTLLLSTSAV